MPFLFSADSDSPAFIKTSYREPFVEPRMEASIAGVVFQAAIRKDQP